MLRVNSPVRVGSFVVVFFFASCSRPEKEPGWSGGIDWVIPSTASQNRKKNGYRKERGRESASAGEYKSDGVKVRARVRQLCMCVSVCVFVCVWPVTSSDPPARARPYQECKESETGPVERLPDPPHVPERRRTLVRVGTRIG